MELEQTEVRAHVRLRGGRDHGADGRAARARAERRRDLREDRRRLRSEVNIELNFPPNFEGLVLGCIDADFASKYSLESS